MTASALWASETFPHYGSTIRVTMTDPPVTGEFDVHVRNVVGDGPRKPLTRPAAYFSHYCPATFIVEGLPYEIEFTIGSVQGKKRHVVITSLTAKDSTGHGISREALSKIPTARLLAAAISAATVTLIHYPENYNGPAYEYDDGTLVEMQNMDVRASTGAVFPVRNGGAPMPADWTKRVAGVAEIRGDQRLREIAKEWKAAKRDGASTEQAIRDRFGVDIRQARRLVRQAREKGYIPPTKSSTTKARGAK